MPPGVLIKDTETIAQYYKDKIDFCFEDVGEDWKNFLYQRLDDDLNDQKMVLDYTTEFYSNHEVINHELMQEINH